MVVTISLGFVDAVLLDITVGIAFRSLEKSCEFVADVFKCCLQSFKVNMSSDSELLRITFNSQHSFAITLTACVSQT